MRLFSYHKDLDEVNSWLKAHNQKLFGYRDKLPKIGMIVPEVAVGFLCQTDGNVGILDPFISNPKATSLDRHKALNQIADWCLVKAKDLGFKRCIMMSFEENILKRAENLGFTIVTVGFGFKELGV